MYDICQFTYQSIMGRPVLEQLNLTVFDHLNKLVASWQPQLQPALIDKFTSWEITCLLGQAYVFKAAVSLVLHRLQHPFGEEDLIATRLSTEILSVCTTSSRIAGEAEKLPQTLFPWMVAAFEVTSPVERRMLLQMELPKSREILGIPTAKMKDSVRFAWNMRDAGHVTSLFSILEQAPTSLVPF